MGRVGKAFCCCFGRSTYEIAPECDESVILKNNIKSNDNEDLTEKLLHTQSQIEIISKNQQQQQDLQENTKENFNIQQQNQNFQDFLNLQQKKDDYKTNFISNDRQQIKANKQQNLDITQQNQNFQEFINLQQKDEFKSSYNFKK